MKKISKSMFIEILQALENDGAIYGFKCRWIENKIDILGAEADVITYYFNDKDNWINPAIHNLQQRIIELEQEKKDLKQQLKNLCKN